MLAASFLLSACGGGGSSASLVDAVAVVLPTPTPTPTPAPAPTPTPTPAATGSTLAPVYDASIGAGVDAAGFTSLPLRSGAHRYFVSSASGSDGNGCAGAQNPSTPLRSIAAAAQCIAMFTTNGDQVLLAEGTSYAEGLPNLSYKGGSSAAYPTVIQSYDPADPLNESKHGRATGARRPAVNTGGTNSQSITSNNGTDFLAIRGLDFNPGNRADMRVSFVGSDSYVLIENNLFRYTVLSFDKAGNPQATAHVIRKNAFFGSWSPTIHSQGVYDDGTTGLTVEDNVFWHNGWKIGASRDAAVADGGTTVFRHALYAQVRTTALVRRNLFMDPSATGISARAGLTAYENVFIDNPIDVVAGLADRYDLDQPNGVLIDVHHNAIFGDADIRTGYPGGGGFATGNGTSASTIHHNLVVGLRGKALNQYVFNNEGKFNQPSNMRYEANLVVNFSATVAGNGGSYPSQVFSTYANNVWDAATSGTNLSNTATTFPSPVTSSDQLFTILGCFDKATCASQIIQSPEAQWGPRIRAILWQDYKAPM